MAASASSVTSSGGRRPGTWAVVMTMSCRAMWPASSSCWAAPLLVGQLAGVAALARRAARPRSAR